MNAQTPDIMLKNQLSSIEERINRLLGLLETLEQENAALKTREQILTQQYSALQQRNDTASSQLEAMINRLKPQPSGTE